MPSGARKRKAAKKKTEIQSNNNNNQPQQSHADHDDVKNQSQEDKDSNFNDVSSSKSQDHNRQNIISENEGEEVEKKKSQIEDIQDKKADEQQSLVQVERELKIEDGALKHGESAQRSDDGGPSGSSCASSGSNSDDESRDVEINASDSLSQKKPVETVQSLLIQKTSDDLNVENSHVPVLEKVPSLSEKVDIESENSAVAPQCSGEDKRDGSMASTKKMEEDIYRSGENNLTIPIEKECIAQESEEKLIVSYDATKTGDDDDDDDVVVSEQDSGVTKPNLCARPHPVRTTSWKSCCGLFELFAGSGQ